MSDLKKVAITDKTKSLQKLGKLIPDRVVEIPITIFINVFCVHSQKPCQNIINKERSAKKEMRKRPCRFSLVTSFDSPPSMRLTVTEDPKIS